MTAATRGRLDTRGRRGAGPARGYTPAWFRADLLAGITVTAYLVPQCLAYADLAGVPPATGLWVAVVAMIVYALLGTSRQLLGRPRSAAAIMVAAAVTPLAAGDPDRYLGSRRDSRSSSASSASAPSSCGWASSPTCSPPVLIGYMAGVAVIMIASQLAAMTGIESRPTAPIARVVELSGRMDEVQPLTFALGLGVTAFLLVLRRIAPLAPGTLIASSGRRSSSRCWGSRRRASRRRARPLELPTPSLPATTVADITALIGSAAAIAFVGYTDVALTGRAFAARTGETIDANREFLALGAANVASGFTGGFALSARGSRTAIIDAMRARSQVTGLVAAASVVVVVLLVPGPHRAHPPCRARRDRHLRRDAAHRLAGLRRLAASGRRSSGSPWRPSWACSMFDVLAGILIAVGYQWPSCSCGSPGPPRVGAGSRPRSSPAPTTSTTTPRRRRSRASSSSATTPRCASRTPRTSGWALRRRGRSGRGAESKWFLLDAEAIVELDVTSADAVRELIGDLEERHIVFAMARVKQDLQAMISRRRGCSTSSTRSASTRPCPSRSRRSRRGRPITRAAARPRRRPLGAAELGTRSS